MADLVKATLQEKRNVNIHNDLANAAFWFKNIIVEKQKNGGPGITLDCMACATMLPLRGKPISTTSAMNFSKTIGTNSKTMMVRQAGCWRSWG
jgi:hypothetical protein